MAALTTAKPRATIGAKKKDVPGLLVRGKHIYNSMLAAVATFVNPTVAMATLLLIIQALDGAQQGRVGKSVTAAARNTKRDALWTALDTLRIYVQGLSDDLDAVAARALIESAGFVVAHVVSHDKPILQVFLTNTPGTVLLVANRRLLVGASKNKQVTFNWSWSADGGKTWTTKSTPLSDLEIPSLTLMTEYQFRVSVTISKTDGVPCDPVRLLLTEPTQRPVTRRKR
jgi:hypothetical protein